MLNEEKPYFMTDGTTNYDSIVPQFDLKMAKMTRSEVARLGGVARAAQYTKEELSYRIKRGIERKKRLQASYEFKAKQQDHPAVTLHNFAMTNEGLLFNPGNMISQTLWLSDPFKVNNTSYPSIVIFKDGDEYLEQQFWIWRIDVHEDADVAFKILTDRNVAMAKGAEVKRRIKQYLALSLAEPEKFPLSSPFPLRKMLGVKNV